MTQARKLTGRRAKVAKRHLLVRPAPEHPDGLAQKLRGILASVMRRPARFVGAFAREHSLAYRSFGAMVVGGPPVVISNYYQVDAFAHSIRTDWPFVAAALDHNVVIWCLLAGSWVFVAMTLRRALLGLSKQSPAGWELAPAVVLKSIENVVGAKEQRFSRYVCAMTNKSPSPSSAEIFESITQPTQQIAELVQGLYSSFAVLLSRALNRQVELKVNLALINAEGRVAEIRFHYPSNRAVRSTVEALNQPHSTIMCAVSSRRIQVVESSLAEGRKAKPRFAVTDPAYSEEDTSVICYPVLSEALGKVVFVISISVDEPGVFREKHKPAYEEVIAPFALRLKLEYALLAMKQREGDSQ